MDNTYAFCWDWKAQPNWKIIFEAVQDLQDQNLGAYHYEIETGSDEYGLLVSAHSGLTDSEAYRVWCETLYPQEEG